MVEILNFLGFLALGTPHLASAIFGIFMPIYGSIQDFYIRDFYVLDYFVREKFVAPKKWS
jgi:hypothetical protein